MKKNYGCGCIPKKCYLQKQADLAFGLVLFICLQTMCIRITWVTSDKKKKKKEMLRPQILFPRVQAEAQVPKVSYSDEPKFKNPCSFFLKNTTLKYYVHYQNFDNRLIRDS